MLYLHEKDGLEYWRKLSGGAGGMLCYGGHESFDRNGFEVRSGNAICTVDLLIQAVIAFLAWGHGQGG